MLRKRLERHTKIITIVITGSGTLGDVFLCVFLLQCREISVQSLKLFHWIKLHIQAQHGVGLPAFWLSRSCVTVFSHLPDVLSVLHTQKSQLWQRHSKNLLHSLATGLLLCPCSNHTLWSLEILFLFYSSSPFAGALKLSEGKPKARAWHIQRAFSTTLCLEHVNITLPLTLNAA